MNLNLMTSAFVRMDRRYPAPPSPEHTSAPLLHYLLAGDAANVVSVKVITKQLLGYCADFSKAAEKGVISLQAMLDKHRDSAMLIDKIGRYVLRG